MERYLKPLLLLLLAANNLVHCQVNDRIVGGSSTNIQSYPWQVSISYNGAPACGGSLISLQYVLSACHCFPSEHDVALYTVTAGTTNLAVTDGHTQSLQIDTITLNPSYNPDAYSGDIVVIKLKQAFTRTQYVDTIKLPSASVSVPAGTPCTITGWGHIRKSESLPNPMTLQVGPVTVISDRTCNCLYHINNSGGSITSITQDMICAGSAQGTVDACQGDSGGPLTCSVNGVPYQVGVVSWGDECGSQNRPGVYTEISYYVYWILSIATDATAVDFTVDMTPVPDDANGCVGSDGNIYPYPNKASVVLVTFMSLPLYWLTAYLLSNL
ncbi:prostasin-like [Hyperolius riggenbachi]|uniref:prostasin-like n=1 Tax=Hyperolius riggenbachi TaxID=752182 RepID=UPI0035A26E4A